jgi:hypothetical protein
MDQSIRCSLMDPARYIYYKAPFPTYISYAIFSANTAPTISYFLWLHFLYHCSTVLSTLLPMLLFFNIYLFIFRIYFRSQFTILNWIYDEIFFPNLSSAKNEGCGSCLIIAHTVKHVLCKCFSWKVKTVNVGCQYVGKYCNVNLCHVCAEVHFMSLVL